MPRYYPGCWWLPACRHGSESKFCASKSCGFTGQVHSVLQYLSLKCLDHSFDFFDTERDLHSTKCILSTLDPHFADWKEILSPTKGTLLVVSHCFAMSEKLIFHWTAYCFMSHSRFSIFNGWVRPRQLLRTLSLMVQPRHWVVWLQHLDVGGYASLVCCIA